MKSLFFFSAFGVRSCRSIGTLLWLSLVGCGTAQAGVHMRHLSDADWVSLAAAVSIDACVKVAPFETEARRRLGSLGFDTERNPNNWKPIPGPGGPRFAAPRDDEFCKLADLAEEVDLVPLYLNNEAFIGPIETIAIVSIDRHLKEPPYLYDTLRSVFREISPESHVNVLIGNTDSGYVSQATLIEEFGFEQANRIHIHTPSSDVDSFLSSHFDRMGWATWNHGRALRSYHGSRYLLVLEDDIVFSQNALPTLAQWLEKDAPSVVSLYNYFCGLLPGAAVDPMRDPGLISYRARAVDYPFSRTQAMVYDHTVARAIGNHMSVRLGKKPLDLMIDDWMRENDETYSFSQPSVVQHTGTKSSGLGGEHQSKCFSVNFGGAPEIKEID